MKPYPWRGSGQRGFRALSCGAQLLDRLPHARPTRRPPEEHAWQRAAKAPGARPGRAAARPRVDQLAWSVALEALAEVNGELAFLESLQRLRKDRRGAAAARRQELLRLREALFTVIRLRPGTRAGRQWRDVRMDALVRAETDRTHSGPVFRYAGPAYCRYSGLAVSGEATSSAPRPFPDQYLSQRPVPGRLAPAGLASGSARQSACYGCRSQP